MLKHLPGHLIATEPLSDCSTIWTQPWSYTFTVGRVAAKATTFQLVQEHFWALRWQMARKDSIRVRQVANHARLGGYSRSHRAHDLHWGARNHVFGQAIERQSASTCTDGGSQGDQFSMALDRAIKRTNHPLCLLWRPQLTSACST